MTRRPRQHGTLAKYKRENCRCQPCRAARRRSDKRAQLRRLERGPAYVDPTRARAHVEELLKVGMTMRQLEDLAGIHRTAIRCLLGTARHRPPSRGIRPSTEQKLLAVTYQHPGTITGPTGFVDGTGTRRRLQALMANGWPARDLATTLGLGPKLQVARQHLVLRSTADAVARLYRHLEHTPGPSPKVATLYRGRGWLPPIWWDDDTIDDPAYEPNVYVYNQHGQLLDDHHATWADRADLLTRRGWTLDQIADALGATPRQVRRALRRVDARAAS